MEHPAQLVHSSFHRGDDPQTVILYNQHYNNSVADPIRRSNLSRFCARL